MVTTRRLLMASAGLGALLMGSGEARAANPPVFSAAWFAGRSGVRGNTAALAAASAANATAGVARSQQSVIDLARMAGQVRAAAAAQAQAAALAQATQASAAVPNGLAPGGLQVAPSDTPGVSGWIGAALPVQQRHPGGRTGVSVTQTASAALMTWTTFNVGARTDLVFDQSAGGAASSTWVAFNRVTDPSANPTQILGSITAPGHVFIVNPNGIIFGAGSQTNVGALLATTAGPTQSDSQFLLNGIYSTLNSKTDALIPTFSNASAGSAVIVQPGAVITASGPTSSTEVGGSVLLFGGAVSNAGSIDTPSGQTVLAAGSSFVLTQGQGVDLTATTLVTQVSVGNGGSATNSGIITADLGDITLTGRTVTQGGIVLSSTSVNQRGTVHLLTDHSVSAGGTFSTTYDPAGVVTLAPGSLTAVTLDTSGAAVPDTTRESLIAASNTLNPPPTYGTLPDQRELSRIEISSGGGLEFGSGSLTMAPGGQVAVTAGSAGSGGRILVDSSAVIDVAGDADAVLPISENAIQISVQTTPLRDAPLNRDDGALDNAEVWVDQRDLVTVPGSIFGYGGNVYTAGGLLAVGTAVVSTNTADGTAGLLQTSGNIALQNHTIQEWAAVGGTIALFGNVIAAQSGSELNVAGGGVTYAAGEVPQSWLIGANGRLYNANTAPADILYTGVYDGFTEVHPHWSISQSYFNALIAPSQLYEPGYTVGRDAGTVELEDAAVTRQTTSGGQTITVQRIAPAVLFNGVIDAGVYDGLTQTAARDSALIDGYQQAQNAVPKPGTLLIGQYNNLGTITATPTIDVQIGGTGSDADSVTPTSAIAAADRQTIALNAASLDAFGLGGLGIATAGSIGVAAPLALSPGGTLALQGANVSVGADLTARGGQVTVASGIFNGSTTVGLTTQAKASLSLDAGATIDARGTFTNAALDPLNVSGEAFVNGGDVTFATEGGVSLAPGSLIDVSSGAAYLPDGGSISGRGGNVTIAGGLAQAGTIGRSPVTVAGTIQGYGVSGGGTLAITGLTATITDAALFTSSATGLLLTPDFFTHGFASYLIDGLNGVTVSPGTTVEPVVPVYHLSASTPFAPTGDSPADALQLWLPPLFLENPQRGTLAQRQGASLTLTAYNGNVNAPDGGTIAIGAGAAIAVDPAQSVSLDAYDQLTVDGTITAPGGSITLANSRIDQGTQGVAAQYLRGLSIWLGSDSRISTAGIAYVAHDFAGRAYGVVEGGGTVSLGAYAVSASGDPLGIASEAAVIVRPGAVVDASGAAADIDQLAGSPPILGTQPSAPTPVTTGGGTIALTSAFGIYDDGTLVAAAGGAGAAGGTLAVVMQSPVTVAGLSGTTADLPPAVIQVPHTIGIVPTASPLLPAILQPGQGLSSRLTGEAVFGTDQIAAGGFDSLALFAQDAFLLSGGVSLNVAGSISFAEGAISRGGSGTAPVSVSADVLILSGYNPAANTTAAVQLGLGAANPSGRGTLTLAANLIQLDDEVAFGAAGTVTPQYTLNAGNITPDHASDYNVSYPGFSQVTLASGGDIRFSGISTLNAAGNLSLAAGQVYPDTNAQATIAAGQTLVVSGLGTVPAVPLSANGQLTLRAASIEQGGILRAPEGDIQLIPAATATGSGHLPTASLTLEPGSITSVSADGALIPYGGTPDNLTYDYAGVPLSNGSTPGNPTVTLGNRASGAQSITVDPGATIDISGGGELVGAGFLAGRGGSADVLTTPLLAFNPSAHTVASQSLAATPVYAIVPGFGGSYAPATPADALYAPVALGQRITIGAGVSGLPAGTYTLLPAYYALLPGGFRVQVNPASHLVANGSQTLADGSTLVLGTEGSAVTGATTSLPVAVTVTPASVVLEDSGYNQSSFSQFQVAEAALNGLPRPAIVADAKTLDLDLSLPAPGSLSFTFGGTLLGQPASGGYGSTVAVAAGANLDIVANGATLNSRDDSVLASDLDALGAQRLVIGSVSVSATLGGVPEVLVTSTAEAAATVDIGAGAVLRAPEIFIAAGTFDASTTTSSGGLVIEPGATISSLGMGPPAYDSAAGYYYALPNFGEAVVAVSNGHLVLVTGTENTGDVALTVGAGASLLSDGSLLLATSGGVTIDPTAAFGARYLTLGAADINVGSTAGLAAAGTHVPAGLILSQGLLTRLLDGDPTSGAPPLESLDLTADSSLNFFGTVQLSTAGSGGTGGGLQQLVVNTPAIYGFGNSGDVATIATGTLYLSGIVAGETLFPSNPGVASPGTSVLPGGTLAGGPGTGSGILSIQAADIVLGYGPQTQADDQTVADRLILGFSTVELQASAQISANNRSQLSVYQAGPAIYGQRGTGGTLDLITPLLTGSPGSQLSLDVGGALSIAAPAGVAPSTAVPDALGAEIDATAASAAISTAIALPSGRLAVTAAGDIALGPNARVDVSGPDAALFDQTRPLPGGSVALESTSGSITQDPASLVNLSATGAGGTLDVTATAGTVSLEGTILGTAGAGAAGATLDVRAGTLADFAGLNQRLDTGGVSGARWFDIATGDLTVDGDVVAQSVALSVDSGSLTIAGTIDASGAAPGTIDLAAGGTLTLAAGSVLDAHGTVLQVDSYGQPIAAENTGQVTLTVSDGGAANLAQGMLVVQPGAAIDLASPDGISRGLLTLNVPRSSETGGGVRAEVPGPLDLAGVAGIVVNGFWTYAPTDAAGSIVQDNGAGAGGAAVSAAGVVGLDQISAINEQFIGAAAPGGTLSPGLQAALAGVSGQPGFRLQPGVEIVSPTADGQLTVVGDLDLSGFRYGPQATGNGAGTPGALVIRAGGNLTFNGSVSDGFGTPLQAAGQTNPDDLGWVLFNTLEPFGQMVVLPADLPHPIVLPTGTTIPHNLDLTLSYPVTLRPAQFAGGQVIPQAVTLGPASYVNFGASYTFASAWTATAAIKDATGAVVFAAGQVIPAGTTLQRGWSVGAGTVLPFAVGIASGTVWNAGSSLAGLRGANGFGFDVTLAASATLDAGALIPAGTIIGRVARPDNRYKDNSSSEDLRPVVDGVQGEVEANAPLLPAGSQSWSMSFVGGADLKAADPLAVQSASALAAASAGAASAAGNITLADLHYTTPQNGVSRAQPSFSVIRTGTGALNLVAGGAFSEDSLFGIYTSGTQSAGVPAEGLIQGTGRYTAYVTSAQANYPAGGGDVLVSAQGDLTGDIIDTQAGYASELVSDWLRRGDPDPSLSAQGGSWWINFGSYFYNAGGKPTLIGFTGIGALGGGNLTISAGGDIGTVAYDVPSGSTLANATSQGLVAAVGATGRVTEVTTDGTTVLGGSLTETGGGTLDISAGGAINPALYEGDVTSDLYGVVTDVRGNIDITAAAVGQAVLTYGADPLDPRAADPFTAEQAQGSGGLVIVPGDSTVSVETRRDLVLQGVGDPGRVPTIAQANTAAVTGQVGTLDSFSLWQPGSAVQLVSTGGNISFAAASAENIGNDAQTDSRSILPPILSVLSASGSLYYGGGELELAPSPDGALDLLAEGSIYAAQQTIKGGGVVSSIAMSGAPDDANDLPNPFRPGSSTELFQFEVDTPTGPLHPANDPAHLYAATGDIVGLSVGEVLDLGTVTDQGQSTLYLAASAADMMAGRDIVASGTRPTAPSLSSEFPNEGASQFRFDNQSAQSSGNLFLNDGPDDVSVVSAGRDILQSYFYVAGGGLLAVQAGRNLDQRDEGVIKSIGPVFDINPTNRDQGASIAVTAGGTPDYAPFAADYLTPGNLANPAFPLASAQNAGKVAEVYTDQLVTFLQQYDGYSGGGDGAQAAFDALPAAQQDLFLRDVFYDELIASGREETDPASSRYHTYIRGEHAIAALFPSSYAGDITMYSGTTLPNGTVLTSPATHAAITFDAGISSLFGGAIQVLAPGGEVVLGTGATIPGSNTGLVTYGSGDISVYALGSVLLGQSRIFTTFGGGIDIWSAQGDISAGVGSKTSLIFSPPLLTYDLFGAITEAPSTPSSGAGIATLAPLAGVPAGDVDLAAPFGTIDAGEAGIRASGNANLAAVSIVNAANVQVGGKVTGTPTVQVANVGALTAASAVSGAAQNTAAATAQQQSSAATNAGSVITVEVLSFGGG